MLSERPSRNVPEGREQIQKPENVYAGTQRH